MVKGFTTVLIFPETEFGYDILYTEGYLILLELFGLLLVISKYFSLLMILFCSLVGIVNNMLYFVILGGVLLVFFVITILMRSLMNVLVPLILVNISVVGGLIFLLMIVLLVLL